MKFKIFLALLFIVIISMGFILRIKVEPYKEDIFSFLKSSFYKKYYFLCNFSEFYKNMSDKKIIIKKISFYPWTLYVLWEEEYTWLYIKHGDKEELFNQQGKKINYYKFTTNTIKVNNISKISTEKVVLLVQNLSKNLNIKEIALYPKYFQVKTSEGVILMDYDNYNESLKIFRYLVKLISNKNYSLDLRFKVPSIRG
ncbi:MAG: hypothetical protein ACPLKX_06065 [Dictyoglomaceae bacterium]